MQSHLLAQILAPAPETAESRLGSGYLVAPFFVLTARHTIEAAGDDTSEPVKVRFPECDRCRWHEASVVWQGTEHEIDLAVLRLATMPDGVDELLPVAPGFSPPRLDQGCLSAGYPAAGERDDIVGTRHTMQRHACVVYEWDAGAHTCQLDITSPPRPDEWPGYSGAPVFDSKRRLIAVVRSMPTAYEGRRLEATPITVALRDPAFIEQVKWSNCEPFERPLRQARSELAAVWPTPQEPIVKALGQCLPGLVVPVGSRDYSSIAEILLTELSVSDLLHVIQTSIDWLNEWKPEAALALGRLLSIMLAPLNSRTAEFAPIGDRAENGLLLAVTATSETFAEIISAGMDGRNVEFREIKEQKEPLIGKANVRFPLIEPGGIERIDTMMGQLREHLASVFLEESQQLAENDVVIDMINDCLEHYANKRRTSVRYYLVVGLIGMAKPDPRFLAEVARVFPQLRVIELSRDTKKMREEARQCRLIKEIYNPKLTGP